MRYKKLLTARHALRPRQPDSIKRRVWRSRRKQPLPEISGNVLSALNRDLRSPLNDIIGMLELLLDSDLNKEQRVFARAAGDSASQLFGQLRDALEYLLIEADGEQDGKATFDLCRQLDEAILHQSDIARGRGVRLSHRYSGLAHAYVKGSTQGIRHILDHHIETALAGSWSGQLQLDIDIEPVSAEQYRLCVAARRMPETTLPSLPAPASGLRLALNQRLLAAMDGHAGTEQQPGKPDLAWIKVDFLAAPSPLNDVRTMFVTANADLLGDRLALLEAFGMRAEGHASYRTAIASMNDAIAAGDPFKLAIIEKTPQDHVSAASIRQLQVDPRYTASQVLLMTGNAIEVSSDMLAHLAANGFSGWLKTPLADHVLLSTLTQMVAKQGAAPAQPFMSNFSPEPLCADSIALFSGLRVLAADDQNLNLLVALHMLKKLGCVVDAATDGMQAVDMHKAHPYDLIFMDCHMPELNGYDASARIRSMEAAAGNVRHTPIIAITGCTLPEELAQCLEAGMDDVITKPMQIDDVRKALIRWQRASALQNKIPAADPL
jgi:two-component system sensor histidine kinase/response regulator